MAALTSSTAAALDTSDWEPVEATPYVLWCPEGQSNGNFTELNIGDVTEYVYRDSDDLSYLSLATYMPIYNDCTYQIEFTLCYANCMTTQNAFNIVDKYPNTLGILGPQFNSSGDSYSSLIKLQLSDYSYPSYEDESNFGMYWYGSYVATKFTYSFSTADGFIDNLENGYYYVTLSRIMEPDYNESVYQFMITDISVKVLLDPGGYYFIDKVIEDLSAVASELDSVGGQLAEADNWLLNKSKEMKASVSDEWNSALNQAHALVTPTRSGTNLLTAASSLSSIFSSFTNSLPPVFQSLLVTLPILFFIAWLIGRSEK